MARIPPPPRSLRSAQVQVALATAAAVLMVVFFAFSSFAMTTPHDPTRDILRVSLEPMPTERVVPPAHERATPIELASSDLADPQAAHVQGETLGSLTVPKGDTSPATAGSIIPLSFELKPNFNPGPEGLKVTKPLALQEGRQTDLSIILVDASRIEIERSALSGALEQLGMGGKGEKLPAKERLSLDTIRNAGIDLRYDAIRDRLVLVD